MQICLVNKLIPSEDPRSHHNLHFLVLSVSLRNVLSSVIDQL